MSESVDHQAVFLSLIYRKSSLLHLLMFLYRLVMQLPVWVANGTCTVESLPISLMELVKLALNTEYSEPYPSECDLALLLI